MTCFKEQLPSLRSRLASGSKDGDSPVSSYLFKDWDEEVYRNPSCLPAQALVPCGSIALAEVGGWGVPNTLIPC